MRHLTRRKLLQTGLGASQLALLGAMGSRPRRARAGGDSGHPSRLLSIYVRGGWMPELFFTPLSATQIQSVYPGPQTYLGEPCFYDPSDVENLDGSGDAPDPEVAHAKRMRAPVLWNEAEIIANGIDPQNSVSSPLGYAWKHNDMFQRACVVHGIDAGTADHRSGRVSMMSGVAGPKFRSPALGAFVADAMFDRFPHRPLQSVSIGGGPSPRPASLGSTASPTKILSSATLEATLSERSDVAWAGLRDRAPHDEFSFDSRPRLGTIDTNAMDEYALRRMRGLYGTVNTGTNAFYEDIYETYSAVSRQLGKDLVTTLEATAGWEHFLPSWAVPGGGPPPYGVKFGLANGSDAGAAWNDQFDLALKLFKSDMSSAVSIETLGIDGFYFDTHDGAEGAQQQFLQGRVVLEQVARLLHEMDATEVEPGRSLLDDTLVVVFSEFSRTWPGTACDHWPFTSVVLAGGGVRGNRQLGNFDLEVESPSPIGVPTPLISEGGDAIERMPRSADVVWTALQLMGIEDVFVPGGVGEIVGVRG
ncbi:MAG: DUF1501 domain-containing protein [Nannocystales bacterium]